MENRMVIVSFTKAVDDDPAALMVCEPFQTEKGQSKLKVLKYFSGGIAEKIIEALTVVEDGDKDESVDRTVSE